jgi:osmoprotectant transport system substrate-binding protein
MPPASFRLIPPAVCALLALSACGSSPHRAASHSSSASTPQATTLPGANRPAVTIGDKNFTEQFVLGELYRLALKAQGYNVTLNPNIGPTEVTVRAMESGRLDMYPEYLGTWNSVVAADPRSYRSAAAAYQAAQHYALAHGLLLLDPTPFSDTTAIGVTDAYADQNRLQTIGDLRKVATTMTLGAPPQFQQRPDGLPAIEQTYGVVPAAFKALEVGAQYPALDQGSVQAAAVTSTDGELASGNYKLLSDPSNVFGWGNAVPIVSAKVADAEGPAFTRTINRVSALLSTAAIRQLNAAVDISHQTPTAVAKQFLLDHGLIPHGTS